MKRVPLTDSEWVGLLRADGEDDNLLPVCCADISRLRDTIALILRTPAFHLSFKEAFTEARYGHKMTREEYPALWKIADHFSIANTKDALEDERPDPTKNLKEKYKSESE